MQRAHKAFSIVELAVVIAVIGVLATITTVGYTRLQRDARDTEVQSDIAVMQSSLETFYEKNGYYPHMAFFYMSASAYGNKKFAEYANIPTAVLINPADSSPSPPLYSYPPESAWSANPAAAANWATSSPYSYVYLSYRGDGATCDFTLSCTRYVLHYKTELEGRKEARSRYGW